MRSRPAHGIAMTFILRLSLDESGRVCGLVERVRTGAKERFYGLEDFSAVIARMVANEEGHHITGGNP
jgi:hypothetical protein